MNNPPDPMSDDGQTQQRVPRDASPYQAHLSRAAQEDGQGPTGNAASAMPTPDLKSSWQALSARQRLRVKQTLVGLATAVLAYGL